MKPRRPSSSFRNGAVSSALLLLVACAATEPLPPPPPAAAPAAAGVAPPAAPPVASAPPTVASTAPAVLPPPAAPPPAPPTSHGPKKVPDVRAWRSHWPEAWTDRRVVAAIADNCDFAPVKPTSNDDPPFGPEDVFACKLPFEQACFPTPCSDETSACKGACEDTCGSCATACSAQCGTCEAACKDQACLIACATTTATCKQACARTMDRCASGTCAQRAVTCNQAEEQGFRANHCDQRCQAHAQCGEACNARPVAERGACSSACDTTLEGGYRACIAACRAPGGSVAQAHCVRLCAEQFPCNLSSCNQL